MHSVTELTLVINKLKKILSSVRDQTTHTQLETFIDELETELEYQTQEFNLYFKQ